MNHIWMEHQNSWLPVLGNVIINHCAIVHLINFNQNHHCSVLLKQNHVATCFSLPSRIFLECEIANESCAHGKRNQRWTVSNQRDFVMICTRIFFPFFFLCSSLTTAMAVLKECFFLVLIEYQMAFSLIDLS